MVTIPIFKQQLTFKKQSKCVGEEKPIWQADVSSISVPVLSWCGLWKQIWVALGLWILGQVAYLLLPPVLICRVKRRPVPGTTGLEQEPV